MSGMKSRKPSQFDIIRAYLRERSDWTPSHELRSVSTTFGWIGHQGDRRARTLAERGEILRRRNDDTGFAEYRVRIEPQESLFTGSEASGANS